MFDLRSVLSEKDKRIMNNYINLYGVPEEDFIGLDAYLQHWTDSKKKLYGLLGNQLQLEFPYNYEKPQSQIEVELMALTEKSKFIKLFSNFIYSEYLESASHLRTLYNIPVLSGNKTTHEIKFKTQEMKKEKVLPKGMKVMRAFQTVMKECPEFFKDAKEAFEEFRIKHSLILNDKIVKGTMVLSIHPFDFITMSDNNSDWTSCMSWVNDGCYHVGTVEMMNSNNVICAYLKSNVPFSFSKEQPSNEYYQWNNKKWRQLFYVTKDIAVGGKAYPFNNKEITLFALKKIIELAEKNKNWKYQYGPEEYRDMRHINTTERMDNNRMWIRNHNTFKHNILFDTKGMYNDMLNCNSVTYWCYRNKVKKTKIISYSGKAPCACCGVESLTLNDYYEDYNDRYSNPARIVCDECYDTGVCSYCDHFRGSKSLRNISIINACYLEQREICLKCSEKYVKICPCCNEPMILNSCLDSCAGIIVTNETVYYSDWDKMYTRSIYDPHNYGEYNQPALAQQKARTQVIPLEDMKVIPVFMCYDCIQEQLEKEDGLFERKELLKDPNNGYSWATKSKLRVVSKKSYTEEEILNHPVLSKVIFSSIMKNDK